MYNGKRVKKTKEVHVNSFLSIKFFRMYVFIYTGILFLSLALNRHGQPHASAALLLRIGVLCTHSIVVCVVLGDGLDSLEKKCTSCLAGKRTTNPRITCPQLSHHIFCTDLWKYRVYIKIYRG
jgi:hypothetical protein